MKRIALALALLACITANAEERMIRVLGIGNSFSEDSIEQNFWEICQSDGTKAIVANMYIGGCSIDRHVKNIRQDLPEYRYTKFDAEGNKSITDRVRLSEVIGQEQWDVISVQQVSGNSGEPGTYGNLAELVAWVYRYAPQAKVVFHQTWAYAVGSDHGDFPRYNCDQQEMYRRICETVKQEAPKAGVREVIPSGTAIQFAREAMKDNNLTRDGYHLSLGIGRYIAACTWYETITGRSCVGIKYRPDGSDPRTRAISAKEAKIAQQAAHKAVQQWKGALDYVPSAEILKAREEFSKDKLGIFIHWGIYSMMADGEWALQTNKLNAEEYSRLAGGFYPSKFDAREWVRAFKQAGAQYMCITSRHHDGFSMFDTRQSSFDIMDATPFKRDVLAELAEACREEGLRLHFYYSHLDWTRPDYWPLGETGHDAGRPEGKDGDWKHYKEFMNAQLTELLTNYGPIGAIWFDGIWDQNAYPHKAKDALFGLREQYDLIHSLQPGCLVGNNHHSDIFPGEDIQIFERDVPGSNEFGYCNGQETSSLPLETCQTMNWTWGYNMKDKDFKSTEDIIRLLARTSGKGANLLLNLGPRPDGTIQETAIQRLKELGEWLSVHGESIYGTVAGPVDEQEWGVTTAKDGIVYVHILKHTDSITLPVKAAKAWHVAGGENVSFKNTKAGACLDIPESDEVDLVIAVKTR